MGKWDVNGLDSLREYLELVGALIFDASSLDPEGGAQRLGCQYVRLSPIKEDMRYIGAHEIVYKTRESGSTGRDWFHDRSTYCPDAAQNNGSLLAP